MIALVGCGIVHCWHKAILTSKIPTFVVVSGTKPLLLIPNSNKAPSVRIRQSSICPCVRINHPNWQTVLVVEATLVFVFCKTARGDGAGNIT